MRRRFGFIKMGREPGVRPMAGMVKRSCRRRAGRLIVENIMPFSRMRVVHQAEANQADAAIQNQPPSSGVAEPFRVY
jgi:hypothetical protein